FTGRNEYLQRLKEYFSPLPNSERKSFLLHGMGGIGKTQICLKFIEETTNWFSDVFWIDASSKDAIELRLKQIGKVNALTSDPTASAALQWISSRDNWLIVYDNADGGYEVIEKFLPPGNKGNILITSRNRAMGRITSHKSSLEVGHMGKVEAILLLLQSAGRDDQSGDLRDVARSIVSNLGYIPLAIDQAGAYIQASNCDLGSYLQLYNDHCAQLMSKSGFKGASDYGYSTYGTWEISMKEIELRATKDSSPQALAAQSALALHSLFAFLHHDNISEEIFRNAAQQFQKRKEEKNELPTSISFLDPKILFLTEKGLWDKYQFQEGIQVLLSFSLI
ncbi:P-loop containing nucleoside triphosphate hydrolase protein, partial [Amanita muscaria]